MYSVEINRFIRSLDKYRLTMQQKRTLKGQALSGNLIAAQTGLARIRGKVAPNGYTKGFNRKH